LRRLRLTDDQRRRFAGGRHVRAFIQNP
jgi:hypothetical protein